MKFRGLRPDEIEVRVGTINAKGANMLLYKDARCDMNVLDETYGCEFWQRDHKVIKDNMYSGVGVWNKEIGQWVWKWDCGTESNTEKEKGEASDSFKRACFNLGIGRELYTGGRIFIPCNTTKDERGKYKLADPFVFYGISVSQVSYKEELSKREISGIEIVDKSNKVIFKSGSVAKNASSDEPTPQEINKIETEKVNKTHIASLAKEMDRTGVKEKQILSMYENLSCIEEMTFKQWTEVMGKLQVTKTAKKQLDL